MNTKINITPDMIKLSKVILKNMEQLSRMVNAQDKNLGHVHAVCYSNRISMNVTIFGHNDEQHEIDATGHVRTIIEDYHNYDKEVDSVDLFEEDEDGENE